MDHDRVQVIDWLLANLYKIFLLLKDRYWQEALLSVYANLTVIENFNEFICCSKHTLLMVILLQKLEIPQKALIVLDYMRDLVEDTNNNKEAILVYQEMGKMYQQMKEYKLAIIAFKFMLQIAWTENDQNYETLAYEYLALQHFYLQALSKAAVYKLKNFHGDLEDD